MQERKCAIIGASVSGLPSARWALAYGITPVVFEKSQDIGGIWNYQQNQSTNYRSNKNWVIITLEEKKKIMMASEDANPWNDVKPETVSRCFRKAGFAIYKDPVRQLQLNVMKQEFDHSGGLFGCGRTTRNRLNTHIGENFRGFSSKEKESIEVDNDTKVMEIEDEPGVDARESSESLRIFQRYRETKIGNPKLIEFYDQMDDILAKERIQKMKKKIF